MEYFVIDPACTGAFFSYNWGLLPTCLELQTCEYPSRSFLTWPSIHLSWAVWTYRAKKAMGPSVCPCVSWLPPHSTGSFVGKQGVKRFDSASFQASERNSHKPCIFQWIRESAVALVDGSFPRWDRGLSQSARGGRLVMQPSILGTLWLHTSWSTSNISVQYQCRELRHKVGRGGQGGGRGCSQSDFLSCCN